MNIMYFILGTIIISLFVGSITYFIIEASNTKKNNNIVGGCQTTRFGCCPNGTTASNKSGSNC